MKTAYVINQFLPKTLNKNSDRSSDKALRKSGQELSKSSPVLTFKFHSYFLRQLFILISGGFWFSFFSSVSQSEHEQQLHKQSQEVLTAMRCSGAKRKSSKRGPGRQTLQMFLLFLLWFLHYCFTWSDMTEFS